MYKSCQMQAARAYNTPRAPQPPSPTQPKLYVQQHTPAAVTSFTVPRFIMKIFFRSNQAEVQHPSSCATPSLYPMQLPHSTLSQNNIIHQGLP